jgi:hypothetical protein
LTLDDLALKHGTDKASFCHDYCPHYEHHLDYLRTGPVHLLEIGVLWGASLRMWADWFSHPESVIIGVDTNRTLVEYPRVRIIETHSQMLQWEQVRLPDLDVVVDDGSHIAVDAIQSFNLLWPHLRQGGWYVIEDTQPDGSEFISRSDIRGMIRAGLHEDDPAPVWPASNDIPEADVFWYSSMYPAFQSEIAFLRKL